MHVSTVGNAEGLAENNQRPSVKLIFAQFDHKWYIPHMASMYAVL